MTDFNFNKIDWQIVHRINEQINRLPQKSDLDLYGRNEFWAMARAAGGDCEDLVLRKRFELKRVCSIPGSALLPATGKLWNGDRHAVLLLDTTHGAYVLDNQTNDIRPWREARIEWYGRVDWGTRTWRSMQD